MPLVAPNKKYTLRAGVQRQPCLTVPTTALVQRRGTKENPPIGDPAVFAWRLAANLPRL
jgi:hypothetical protein